LAEDVDKSFSLLLKNALKISHESFLGNGSETNKFIHDLRGKGSELLSNSKAAIVLIRNEKNKIGNDSAVNDEPKNFLNAIGDLLVVCSLFYFNSLHLDVDSIILLIILILFSKLRDKKEIPLLWLQRLMKYNHCMNT
jgi:hypothetical protein